MASKNIAICQICFTGYDNDTQQPKILPCGHTFCSRCLMNLTERNEGQVACPLCKRVTTITDLSELTTNYSILDLTSFDGQQEESLASSSTLARAEPRPPLSAGICEEHGQDKMFRCKTCDEWICHVCTVIEHPVGKCSVISIKKALEEKKKDVSGQVEQFLREFNLTFDRLEAHDKELQTLEKAFQKSTVELEKVLGEYREIEQTVGQEHLKVKKAKDEGLAYLQDLKETQKQVAKLSRLQEVEDYTRGVSHYKELVQRWTQDMLDMTNGQNMSLSKIHCLTNFSLELMNWSAIKNLPQTQLKAIIDSARESIMVSLFTLSTAYVQVMNYGHPLYASVSMEVNNTAMVGDLCSAPPSASTSPTILPLMEILRKIPEAYALQGIRYYRIEKVENEDRFKMAPTNGPPPADRFHLQFPMRTLIQSGVVWVMLSKGRFGHLTCREDDSQLKDGAVMKQGYRLHSSVDQDPPEESVTYKCNLYGTLISSPMVVFLRLAWCGRTRGDLIIMLDNASIRSKQFLMLCLGDCEHSYRGTSFLSVANFGNPGEMITGGDYENNDGTGGQSILPDLPPREQAQRPVTAGLVSGNFTAAKYAQFVIYTKNLPGSFDYLSFGRVTSGMELLEKAVLVNNIRDVMIEDCGAVL
ncbi:uncharacterized protein LOC122254439 isoform X2 [Penaeus japonicus]|uniref:uncharacterized protein LOC122254439 isoform X2 n=1 Tax=Penaeus japonicus TaxID=27405 RepID=UPI001C70C642|nr:uncharacterized protein LOC122254439 isoform X2 [Penaeus japonicus]